MKKIIIGLAIASSLFIIGIVVLLRVNNQGKDVSSVAVSNVTIEGGKQVVTIRAKGGYLPKQSVAKAGMPTVLRFDTNGTFDCSSSLRISSLNITKTLPQTGSTDIDLGTAKAGTLQGTCGMGMYPFEVTFQG